MRVKDQRKLTLILVTLSIWYITMKKVFNNEDIIYNTSKKAITYNDLCSSLTTTTLSSDFHFQIIRLIHLV